MLDRHDEQPHRQVPAQVNQTAQTSITLMCLISNLVTTHGLTDEEAAVAQEVAEEALLSNPAAPMDVVVFKAGMYALTPRLRGRFAKRPDAEGRVTVAITKGSRAIDKGTVPRRLANWFNTIASHVDSDFTRRECGSPKEDEDGNTVWSRGKRVYTVDLGAIPDPHDDLQLVDDRLDAETIKRRFTSEENPPCNSSTLSKSEQLEERRKGSYKLVVVQGKTYEAASIILKAHFKHASPSTIRGDVNRMIKRIRARERQ